MASGRWSHASSGATVLADPNELLGTESSAPLASDRRFGWRAPDWRILALGVSLLIFALAIGVYVTTVGPRSTGELGLDVALSHHRDFIGIVFSESISTLLNPVIGPLLVVAAGAVIWRRNRQSAVLLVALTCVGWLSAGAMKLVFHRARPPFATVNAVLIERGHDSFPSGHTALASAIVASAVVVLSISGASAQTRWLVALAGAAGVVLVAASRLYLGVHYLADTAAAPLCAVGTVLIVSALLPTHPILLPPTRLVG